MKQQERPSGHYMMIQEHPLQCKLLVISHIDTFLIIPYINLSQYFIVLLTKGKHTAALFKLWKVEDGDTAHTTLTKPMKAHTEVIATVRFYSCSIPWQMSFGVFLHLGFLSLL